MDKKLVHISKFLSMILRHRPEEAGVTLDKNGWVDVDELINLCGENLGVNFTREQLRQMIAENDKPRFSFNEDETKIKANYGHSVPVDLALEPATPPEILYHGTAIRFLDNIQKEGIMRRARNYVHLSADEETALEVGSRHGKPIVLNVDTGKMARDGFTFFKTNENTWLTEKVPKQYVDFPDVDFFKNAFLSGEE
jgi:putative RNA 2'-phosphotransferase